MRRWYYFASAAIASLALVASIGFLVRSSSDAQEAAPAAVVQPASKNATSRIDKVTVYPQNALVTREVDVPAGAGLIELTVPAMPERQAVAEDD